MELSVPRLRRLEIEKGLSLMLDRNQVKIDSLQRQLDFLQMLEGRHVVWASDTANIDAKSKHLDIADTLRRITDEYEFLLKFYSENTDSSG